MKRFVSLGSALMMGVVLGETREDFDYLDVVKRPELKVTDAMHHIKPFYKENVEKINLEESPITDEGIKLGQLDPNDDGYGAEVDWAKMVPQKPTTPIQCGRTMKIVAGHQKRHIFLCIAFVFSAHIGRDRRNHRDIPKH